MDLMSGAKRGPYEIVSLLGKGGMGEVWRARDARLNRDVAIKTSNQRFSDQFEREARAIAALNHPNVCTVHDVGPDYLVMELVEGPTLAERIAEGPIPLDEALVMARQIADALEAAHEKAIVHRDLKPANIKVRPDGSVKVLDFGLAKADAYGAANADSPTLLSMSGVIQGTAGYMSPEQARGKPVDKRSDIFAYGVVLYEMVTGRRLFHGETVADVLTAVMKDEPDWTPIPQQLRRLLRACLQKDVRNRLHDIADARLLLDEIAPSAQHTAPSSSRGASWLWPGMAVVFASAFAGVAVLYLREQPVGTPLVHATILPPENTSFFFDRSPNGVPALSADGGQAIFGALAKDGSTRLWLRPLDSMTAQPLAGTEGVSVAYPFWSPDGRSVGFGARGKLNRLNLTGGPSVPIADAVSFRGASWGAQGDIVFAPSNVGPLQRVAAQGGTSTPATTLDQQARENSHRWPWFLPDGRHFLFAATSAGNTGVSAVEFAIRIGSLDSNEAPVVLKAGSNAVYASGHLLFIRENTLLAQPFDATRLVTTGDAVPVTGPVGQANGIGFFAVSASGTLLAQSGGVFNGSLAWLDRAGKRLSTLNDSGQAGDVRLSPDGARASVTVYENITQRSNVWIYDLARNLRTRLTFAASAAGASVWVPGGDRLIYSSRDTNGKIDLYQKATNGSGVDELLYADDASNVPNSVSPDGRFLIYTARTLGGNGDGNLWVLPLDGERTPTPFRHTPFSEGGAQFSPDGRWVAWVSDESGRGEVYVAPFQGAGGKRQVSVSGGTEVRWRGDGKELFYLEPGRRLMAAQVASTGTEIEIGTVVHLFTLAQITTTGRRYDVSDDGQRILTVAADEEARPEPLTLITNWPAGLKR